MGITQVHIPDMISGDLPPSRIEGEIPFSKINGAPVSVLDYGATGDGTTDDTQAIQDAIDAGYVIYFPPTAGGYKVSSATLTIPSNRTLLGDYGKTKIIHANGSWLFDIAGSFVTINGFQFDCTAVTSDSVGIFRLRSDTLSMEYITISNIYTNSATRVIADVASSNVIVNLNLKNWSCRLHRGNAVYLQTVFAYLQVEEVTVDFVGGSVRNYTAFRVENNQGSRWTQCDVTGGDITGTTSSQHGFLFNNCIAVWMYGCMADTCGGNGFYLYDNCSYFYFENCVASLCDGFGFGCGEADGGTTYQLRLSNCTVQGRRLQTYKTSDKSAYTFDSCDTVQLSNCEAVDSTGDGFYMNGTVRYNMSNCRGDTNSLYGMASSGSSNGLVTGCSFYGNVTDNAALATTTDHIVSCVNNAGAVFSLTGPGTA